MLSLQETLGYKIMLLRDQIHDHSKKDFQQIGITYGNYVTMLYIHDNPGITQAGLADLNHKDRNVIGQTIDKLEKKQYVQRVRGDKDRRSFTLYLTDSGREIVSQYWDVIVDGEEKLFQKITEEEKTIFCFLLEKLLVESQGTTYEK